MKGVFDIIFGFLAPQNLSVMLVAMAVCLTFRGLALCWSDRVERNNVNFKTPNFRRLLVGSPAEGTQLQADLRSQLTLVYFFYPKAAIPSCRSFRVVMCVAGVLFALARLCLNSKTCLLCSQQGVRTLLSGRTVWAQGNSRDELPIPEKVNLDFA
jgi:O-antigen biosynthesis protein WbqP